MMEIEQPPIEGAGTFVSTKYKYDEFLSLPSVKDLKIIEGQQEYTAPLHRTKANSQKDHTSRFQIQKRNFDHQYYGIYVKRLNKMRPQAIQRAKTKWADEAVYISPKLLDLTEGEKCIVVGTIYKEMPLVPRVLDQYVKERFVGPLPVRQSYVSKEDRLILEDDTGRLMLCEKEPLFLNGLVTGVVVAIKGTPLRGGEFEMEEICYPDLAPQRTPFLRPALSTESKYVALVSGMRVGEGNQNSLALQLFVDFLAGDLGSMIEHEFASRIVKVIVAGNSLCAPEKLPDSGALKGFQQTLSDIQQQNLASPLKELDLMLAQIASTSPVDLMPGESDPTNNSLPQQPINRVLLPKTSRFVNYKAYPNPYETEIEGKTFFGTSGQNLDNVEKYLAIEDKLELAERTLRWSHYAPTAPDQLPCYPFYEDDPFVQEHCPHVYFVGNQKEFKTKLIHGPEGQVVRIILVPAFAETSTVVLINLETLDTHPITFKTM